MLRYEPPSTYFLHIPKTAGIAFGSLVGSAYRHRERLNLAPIPLVQLTVEQACSYRHYHAWHQNRGMFDLMQRPGLACITLLREPVERAVSAMLYRQRCATDKPEEFSAEQLALLLPLRHAGLGECLDHPIFLEIVDNFQTRLLGTWSDYTTYFKGTEEHSHAATPAITVPLPLYRDLPDPNAVLDRACTWLAEMAVIGLTERYAQSAILTCDFLGIRAPATLARANINPQRSSATMRYRDRLDPAVLARLEELNRADIELYAFAHERFEQQWASYQAHPRRIYSVAPRLRHITRSLRAKVRRTTVKVSAFIQDSARALR